MNKTFIRIGIVLLAVSFLLGCSNLANSGISTDTSKPTTDIYTKISNARSICSSKIAVEITNNSNRAASTEENTTVQTITYFQGDTTKPFIFYDRSGKKYIFTLQNDDSQGARHYIPAVIRLSNHTIAFRYDTVYEVEESENGYLLSNPRSEWESKALVDLKTGNFYDFSDYEFEQMKSNKDYIFALGSRYHGGDTNPYHENTLYKIDINTLKAEPLNNPNYTDIGIWDIYEFQVLDDDKIIVNDTRGPYILFINSNRPPCKINLVYKKGDSKELIGHYDIFEPDGYEHTPTMYQFNNGSLYIFNVGYYYEGNIEKGIYITAKVKLEVSETDYMTPANFVVYDITETPYPDYISHYTKYYEVFFEGKIDNYITTHGWGTYEVIRSNSYILKPDNLDDNEQNFVINMQLNNNNITTSFYPINNITCKQPFVLYKDKFIWTENNSIKTLDYKTDTINTIYTKTNTTAEFIPYISFLDDSVIFYEYMSKTTVGTFSIPLSGGEKKQISEHEAEIKDLIVLDL